MYPRRKKTRNPDSEQRRWPRLKPDMVPFLKGISFGQGSEAQVIDISRGGLLLETEVRLRPTMKIQLRVSTSDGAIKLDGTVLRSCICSLNGIPRYQSAISFDNPFHMLDDLSTEPGLSIADSANSMPLIPAEQGNLSSLASPVKGKFDEKAAVVTLTAKEWSGSDLADILKRNSW